jgi:hypothetical protein
MSGRVVALVLAALLVVVGGVWTLQGLDYIKGSAMSGVQLWAVLGPVVAGVGVALALVAGRRR